ncbi:PaaI family thioesterase [Pseudohoeflea coraliihabitans]|uniref:PaaI family thioesterase n=1 Tax=Pseudohoeflea coraliihabitans TaxID=2860393 RepID=A0ABS6WLF0_9HYPH|nr:PaaI family thioesterase [Pseudohoeflea sp. DP4N28-3]MBW3096605.1 PaaI family thioesterase [Pseudohoeflea sp. DP4N28-3]
MSTSDFDPAAEGWEPVPDAGFIDHVGPFWQRLEGSGRAYGFAARDHHANLLGVVQGGMIMTFADRVFGLEAWAAADQTPCVTVQFSCQFIAATPLRTFVTTQPEIVRKTRSLVFVEGRVFSNDALVASCQGVWKIVARRPKTP